MLTKVLFFISISLLLISCRAAGEIVVNGQTTVETNINTSQSNAAKPGSEAKNKTFAKTFVTDERFSDESGDVVYTDHLIEFKDENSHGVGVYVDEKKKSFLKAGINHPRIRADFSENGGDRFFVLVTSSAGFGTCADAVFAVVKLDEKLDVTVSRPNEPDCQGESYDVKIENVNDGSFHRRIAIGTLKFNLKSFDWYKESKK